MILGVIKECIFLLNKMSSYFLFGFIVAGVIHVFVKNEQPGMLFSEPIGLQAKMTRPVEKTFPFGANFDSASHRCSGIIGLRSVMHIFFAHGPFSTTQQPSF